MNDIDQNEAIGFLEGLYPKAKFTEAQLFSFRQVLRFYEYDTVRDAMTEFQANSPYTMKPSDLKAICEKSNPTSKYVKTPHFVYNSNTGWFTQIIVPGHEKHLAIERSEEIRDKLQHKDKFGEPTGDVFKVYRDTTVAEMIAMRYHDHQHRPRTVKEAVQSTQDSRKPTNSELNQRRIEMTTELAE